MLVPILKYVFLFFVYRYMYCFFVSYDYNVKHMYMKIHFTKPVRSLLQHFAFTL